MPHERRTQREFADTAAQIDGRSPVDTGRHIHDLTVEQRHPDLE